MWKSGGKPHQNFNIFQIGPLLWFPEYDQDLDLQTDTNIGYSWSMLFRRVYYALMNIAIIHLHIFFLKYQILYNAVLLNFFLIKL